MAACWSGGRSQAAWDVWQRYYHLAMVVVRDEDFFAKRGTAEQLGERVKTGRTADNKGVAGGWKKNIAKERGAGGLQGSDFERVR